MKVVITWASWFVWKHLVNLYHAKWHTIISCQRKKLQEIPSVIYKYFDYTFPIQWDSDFQNIDLFIHCGSCTDYTETRTKLYQQNVESLKNIQEISAWAKHFIYISSSSVYQSMSWKIESNSIINEKNLINSYSYSKYKAEQYIKNNFKNTSISILRPRAIYWDGDTTIIPQVLKNSIFWYLLLPGAGDTKTSLSDIDEFSEYIFNISQNNTSGTFNFSSQVQTYNQIYKQIQNDYHKKWIIYIPLPVLKLLYFFNKNKYSYIIDTFSNDKILL
jgi:nucleoside-diphosphate-sugar epimerase